MTTETPKEGVTARLLWWLGVLMLVGGGAAAIWAELGVVGVAAWWCVIGLVGLVFYYPDMASMASRKRND